MALHIDHVVLWVEDPLRALDFYTQVVGLAGVRVEEFRAGKAPFPSVRLSEASIFDLMPVSSAQFLRSYTGEEKPSAAGKPINHVCFAMTRGEFDALAARLAAANVAMHTVENPSFGARGFTDHWFYFQDPDGNTLEARHYE
ncbi:dioxygenase [Sorangium cellulosum]|uniref:Dioxygenase n=1 Tax=Sorangium cellulosum TaxID=56 RepID=A0A2L0EMS2_SORCE|nr:VOC family protein [Sorangium cellulosum]AUX40589.1 dioxygenase [Sorangium cellulosum]